APEGDIARRLVARRQRDHEDQRHDRGEAEPEIRPLQRDQLAQLPAVDGQHAGTLHATTSVWTSLGGTASPAPPSVSLKNSDSRLTVSGISASVRTPRAASASDSAPTDSSSAVKQRSAPSRRRSCTPV